MVRFTIAIPARNRSNLLAALLDSIAANSERPDEVLVVDNHGEEDLGQVCSSYASELSLRYVRNPRDLGYVGNVNRCLELVQTEYFAVVHSDNLLSPHFCAIARRAAARWPDAGLICLSPTISAEPPETAQWPTPGEEIALSARLILDPARASQLPRPVCSGVIHNRAAMNRAPSVRYDTALPYSADELFFAELACRGGRVDLPIEAVWDRPHDDNTMYRTWQMPDFAFRFLETRYRKHLLEESDGDWLTRSADAHRLAARETAETLAQLTLERLAGRHRGAPSVENIAAGLWIDPTSFIRGLGKPVARGLARLLGRRKR